MEYSIKPTLSLNSNGIIYPLSLPHKLSIGIIFHSNVFTNGGESIRGLSKSPFLAINAKGEKIFSPKQKDRTTAPLPFQKIFEMKF
jgi:hypothetical protein